MSRYVFGKTVRSDFDQAVEAVIQGLAKEGFGARPKSTSRRR